MTKTLYSIIHENPLEELAQSYKQDIQMQSHSNLTSYMKAGLPYYPIYFIKEIEKQEYLPNHIDYRSVLGIQWFEVETSRPVELSNETVNALLAAHKMHTKYLQYVKDFEKAQTDDTTTG